MTAASEIDDGRRRPPRQHQPGLGSDARPCGWPRHDQGRDRGGEADRGDVEAQLDDRVALPDLHDHEQPSNRATRPDRREVEQRQQEWDLREQGERVAPDLEVQHRDLGQDEQPDEEHRQRPALRPAPDHRAASGTIRAAVSAASGPVINQASCGDRPAADFSRDRCTTFLVCSAAVRAAADHGPAGVRSLHREGPDDVPQARHRVRAPEAQDSSRDKGHEQQERHDRLTAGDLPAASGCLYSWSRTHAVRLTSSDDLELAGITRMVPHA